MKIKNRNEFIEQKPRSKKRKLNYGTQLAHNVHGLAMWWNLKIVCPELLLIKNTKVEVNQQKPNRITSAETTA